jgi:hypothetical protein
MTRFRSMKAPKLDLTIGIVVCVVGIFLFWNTYTIPPPLQPNAQTKPTAAQCHQGERCKARSGVLAGTRLALRWKSWPSNGGEMEKQP